MSDASEGKAPVIASVAAAWRFFSANWSLFVPGALFVGVAAGLGDLVQAMATNAAGPSLGPVLMNGALNLVASAVFVAAVLRKAVRDETTGLFGLTFGSDEVRLIGVSLSLAVMILPVFILLALVFTVFVIQRIARTPEELQALLADPDKFSQALQDSLGQSGMLAMFLLIVLIAAIAVWAAVRLILINAATIGERRIMIFQTWKWTHDNFFRVLAAWVLTALPVIVAVFGSAILIGALTAGQQPTTAIEVFLIAAVAGFISAMCQIPSLALVAHLYRGFRPSDLPPAK
ncbi:MAG: hypothetical protein ABI740_10555 [Alphaproteobacteria bacterium]